MRKNGDGPVEKVVREFAWAEFVAASHFFMQRGFAVRRLRMLEAHGMEDKTKWLYMDSKTGPPCSMDQWISESDGQYDLLFISCCNPSSHTIHTKKSLAIYPSLKCQGLDILRAAYEGVGGIFNVWIPEDSSGLERITPYRSGKD